MEAEGVEGTGVQIHENLSPLLTRFFANTTDDVINPDLLFDSFVPALVTCHISDF